jgi:hypothetical protein
MNTHPMEVSHLLKQSWTKHFTRLTPCHFQGTPREGNTSSLRIFGRLREEKARLQQAIDEAKRSQDMLGLDLVEQVRAPETCLGLVEFLMFIQIMNTLVLVQIMSENNRLRADVAGKSSDLQLALARSKETSTRLEHERDLLRAELDDMRLHQRTGRFISK